MSDTFDPNEHKPDPNKKFDESPFLDHAGTFVLAAVWMGEMKESKNGKLNARFKFRVIGESTQRGLARKEQGYVFFDAIYFAPTTYERLGALCAAMGVKERFEFEATSVRRALLWKPFKTSVKIEAHNGKRYAKLGFVKLDVTDEERDAMNQFVLDAAEERDAAAAARGAADDFGAPSPDDDDLDF